MRIRVVDAFTDRPFAGNPAAVCLLDGDWPDEAWMQRVAMEMSLSETAFARPTPDDPEADWGLRWFTPTVETNLCGHATLATTHVIAPEEAIRFSTRSGVLIAQPTDDGAITLDFPANPPVEAAMPDGLTDALGAKALAAYQTGALRDVVVVLASEDAVRTLTPDLNAIAEIGRRTDTRGVIVTARADHGAYDFVSRFFCPHQGIPEDPVTGSAHTALAPYWSQRLARDELVGLQASKRTGLVRTALRGDRVHLTGQAVTVLDGTLNA
ncbi:PhzF family phenazine biosynthesis protein [Fodinicola acaciae]|uniref:PhzF family phenazine biosynthesis protein n=1 Tax=Fodinicola acaciae TaxID=2681555 RepID=UPI0013D40B20|nr:PhzF family phenazine biosynthesis protein [Fodinicola acaciae]